LNTCHQPTSSDATANLEPKIESALHPAIARFNASIGFDIELIEYDITGSAHAKCAKCPHRHHFRVGSGILVAGLGTNPQEYRHGQFTRQEAEWMHRGATTDRNCRRGGEKTARSRNDQVQTPDFTCVTKYNTSAQHCAPLGELLHLAEQHVETLIPGYMHLQRAQPLSLAHHLPAYFQMAQQTGNV